MHSPFRILGTGPTCAHTQARARPADPFLAHWWDKFQTVVSIKLISGNSLGEYQVAF